MSGRFVVVVPVKSPDAGKSRLAALVERPALASAFATDMVAAALAAPSVEKVLVTTDDPRFADRLARLGAQTMIDGARGLNPALRAAAVEARRRWPDLVPVAVLADLPALRPADLEAALAVVAADPDHAWFVADADTTGTVLYTGGAGDFSPCFGTASAAAHRDGGARPIESDLPSLRRDVDDPRSLALALELGVGPATARVLAVPSDDAAPPATAG